MKNIISKVYLPAGLHKRMKTLCAARDVTIKDYLQALLIDGIIKDLKKKLRN